MTFVLQNCRRKLRHATVLALVGWYLMVQLKNHPTAGMEYWPQIDSFDTAVECRKAGYEAEERVERRHPNDQLMINQFKAWVCIATDDPRLKGK